MPRLRLRYRLEIDGEDTIIDSPWSSDPQIVSESYPELADSMCLHSGPATEGRININLAPVEVLRGVPGMSGDTARKISAAQKQILDRLISRQRPTHTSVAWLLTDGLVDLDMLRKLAPFITAGGDVYRFRSIGSFGDNGPVTQIEAVIDVSTESARVVLHRDLPPMNASELKRLRRVRLGS